MTEKPKCATCAYWEKSGECRRRKPAFGVNEFPPIGPDEWCGEHSEFGEWLKRQGVQADEGCQEHLYLCQCGSIVCKYCGKVAQWVESKQQRGEKI